MAYNTKNRTSAPSSNRGRSNKKQENKQCLFCTNDVDVLDYKDVNLLKNFLTYQFKIAPRARTGTCSRHQRRVANAIKRARLSALIPFTHHR